MNDLRHLLTSLDDEAPLSATEKIAMRRMIVAEANCASLTAPNPFAMAIIGGALTLATAAGVLVTRAQPPAPRLPSVTAPGDVRQLQFATPGGTRIIWQFNPEFSLRETIP